MNADCGANHRRSCSFDYGRDSGSDVALTCAARAAPTPLSEYVALARDVAYTTPEISKRTAEQVVDGPEDDADIFRHEQMLLGYQANIDHCVHMLKTKERNMRRRQLFSRSPLPQPLAKGASGRKWLMKTKQIFCITDA